METHKNTKNTLKLTLYKLFTIYLSEPPGNLRGTSGDLRGRPPGNLRGTSGDLRGARFLHFIYEMIIKT